MARNQFTKAEQEQIVSAIESAELETSGEVVVHIESKCKTDAMERAKIIFSKLGVDRTELRNGVLFYVATIDHKFAILGDSGIDSVTPDDFWEEIKAEMLLLLKEGKVALALSKGIKMAGDALKSHFPYQSDDVNELDNNISFGE